MAGNQPPDAPAAALPADLRALLQRSYPCRHAPALRRYAVRLQGIHPRSCPDRLPTADHRALGLRSGNPVYRPQARLQGEGSSGKLGARRTQPHQLSSGRPANAEGARNCALQRAARALRPRRNRSRAPGSVRVVLGMPNPSQRYTSGISLRPQTTDETGRPARIRTAWNRALLKPAYRRWALAAWVLLIAGFATAHAIHLQADFPNHS